MNDRWKPLKKWTRRTLAIVWHVLAFAFLTAGLIPLLVLAALFDATRGNGNVVTRIVVFCFWYLACELAGLAALLVLRFTEALLPGEPYGYDEWNERLARWWTLVLARGAMRIFGIEVVADSGDYRFGVGPLLVFARHASDADALLAAVLLCAPQQVRLRYVLPQRMLWNPCVDIFADRLPTVFVRSTASYCVRECAELTVLARNLAPGEALLFHPEAGHFTPARKARAVARLRDEGRERSAREAAWLRHLLPPRAGEAVRLLDAAPEADVAFLAHTGLEAPSSAAPKPFLSGFPGRLAGGGLVGKTVHAKLRFVSSCDVPYGRDAREGGRDAREAGRDARSRGP